MNWDEHYANRDRLSTDELAPFVGKHVAWSLDGTRIVASGEDDGQVLSNVQAAGFALENVVISYLPRPDETLIGGSFVEPAGGDNG
jgi:hypothetical protein